MNHRRTTLDNALHHPALPYLLLAGITLLAAGLRFYKLGEWSYWVDEIFTINRAQIHFQDLWVVIQNIPTRLWFPISLVLTELALDTLGVSEFTSRLAPALIGIATIPIVFFATRRHFGTWTALVLALLLALAPWHLFWSQNARFYTMLMLLYTLAGLVFFDALERNRPWHFFLFYVLLYFAMSERLQAAFVLFGALAYLGLLWVLRFERPPGWNRRNMIIFLAPFAGMLLFELVRYFINGQSTTTSFVENFSGMQIADPIRLSLAILFNIGIPIAVFAVATGIYLVNKRSRAGLFLLVSSLLPVITLVLFNPILFTKDRYVFMTLPFWLLLVAIGVVELFKLGGRSRWLLTGGVLLVFLAHAASTMVLYYQVNQGHRLQWRTAFSQVQAAAGPEDVVTAFWPEFGPFYLDRDILAWEEFDVDAMLASGQQHWFVLDSETEWINRPAREWLDEQGDLVDLLYLRQPEGNFNIRIYRYDPQEGQP